MRKALRKGSSWHSGSYGIFVLLVASIAFCQSPVVPLKDAASDPLIRVSTRLAQMSVIVTDKRGHPVRDLSRADFAISDNGKLMPIAVFEVDRNDPAAQQLSEPKPVPPNVVSNLPATGHRSGVSWNILLLDLLNTAPEDQIYAIKEAAKASDEPGVAGAAVYILDGFGNLKVLQDFASDNGNVAPMLKRLTASYSAAATPVSADLSSTRPHRLASISNAYRAGSEAQSSLLYRARHTSDAFRAIASRVAGLRGRKNLVWLSAGLPAGWPSIQTFGAQGIENSVDWEDAAADVFEVLQRGVRSLETENVAVYPIDARGLRTPAMADASRKSSTKLRVQGHLATEDPQNLAAMQFVASRTGGRAFFGRNDLAELLHRALDDSRLSYTLGFYMPEESADVDFRKVQVHVKPAGLTVRTKEGYLATAQRDPSPKSIANRIDAAIADPLESTGIGITGRLDPSPDLKAATRVSFAFNPAQLTSKPGETQKTGSIDLAFVQLTLKGKSKIVYLKAIDIPLPQKGFVAYNDVTLDHDAESVRIIVVDRVSEQVGSVTLPLQIAANPPHPIR